MLFITTQKGQHRSTKILVKNVNIQSHPSVPVMQRLYEAVVRGIYLYICVYQLKSSSYYNDPFSQTVMMHFHSY